MLLDEIENILPKIKTLKHTFTNFLLTYQDSEEVEQKGSQIFVLSLKGILTQGPNFA